MLVSDRYEFYFYSMGKVLVYLSFILALEACIPDSDQINPVINPDLQVKSSLDSTKLTLTLSWNDFKKHFKTVSYTVVLQKYFVVNQYDTVARNYDGNALSGIASTPNTTVRGTVIARNGQGQVFRENFTVNVGAPVAPNGNYFVLQDVSFERYLIDAKIDSDKTLNGLLLKSDAQKVEYMNLREGPLPGVDYYPANLKGIEHFESLTYLDINTAFTDSLDVSQNTKLTFLDCRGYNVPGFYQAELNDLVLGNKSRLTTLICGSSGLTSLDLSRCPALKTLVCASSHLTELKLTACSQLEYLNVSGNNLQRLDVTGNSKLRFLDCSGAQSAQGLASLDLSQNVELRELHCINQRIATPLSLCTNTKLLVSRTDHTPIPTIAVPFPIDETLLTNWSKDRSTEYKDCN